MGLFKKNKINFDEDYLDDKKTELGLKTGRMSVFLVEHARQVLAIIVCIIIFSILLFPNLFKKKQPAAPVNDETLQSNRLDGEQEDLPVLDTRTPEEKERDEFRDVISQKVDENGNEIFTDEDRAKTYAVIFGDDYEDTSEEVKELIKKVNSAASKYNYFEKTSTYTVNKNTNGVIGKDVYKITGKKDLKNREMYYFVGQSSKFRGKLLSSVSVECYQINEGDESYCYYYNSEIGLWQKAYTDDITTYDVSALVDAPEGLEDCFEVSDTTLDDKDCFLLQIKDIKTDQLVIGKTKMKDFSYKLYVDKSTYLPIKEETVYKYTQDLEDASIDYSTLANYTKEIISEYKDFSNTKRIEMDSAIKEKAHFVDYKEIE